MWYKNSDRGYIDFKNLANKMAEIIYPELEKAKNDFKSELNQIIKNYKILNTYYDSLSKDEQKKELKRYQDFVNIISEDMQYELEKTFSQARFSIRTNDLHNDFDIDVFIHPNNEWKASYLNKKLVLSILDINSQEELAETLEHELIHIKQFKHMPNKFSPEKTKKIKNTNYFDIKEEGPAFVSNVLRELPLKEYLDHQFQQMKLQNSWMQFEDFVMEELTSLLSNSYKMQNFLNLSDWYRRITEGDGDPTDEDYTPPMQQQIRKNKFNKILHEAISKQAREILLTL